MESDLRDALRIRSESGSLKLAANKSTVLGMRIKDAFSERGLDVLHEDHGATMSVATLMEMRAYARHVAFGDGKRHRLSALPGLGKSSYFPMVLAQMTGRTVVVLEHSEALAVLVRDGAEAMRLDGSRDSVGSIPTVCSGWDVLGAVGDGSVMQVVYAPLRAFMNAEVLKGMPTVYVVHDESHFSDYVTYAWRHICADMSWVAKHVQMSATLDENVVTDVVRARTPGGAGRFIERMEIGPVAGWSLHDAVGGVYAPWAEVNVVSRNTVVFSDDLRANEQFADKLNSADIRARCLDARSTSETVLRVFAEMKACKQGYVVFVDSTFRSGYTFFADAVIETGMVRESYCDANGRMHERYRVAYTGEMYQAVARVGRVRDGFAYVNDVEYAAGVNSLAVGETRHACALVRLMGYQPDETLCEIHPSARSWSRSYCLEVLRSDGAPDSDGGSDDEGHVGATSRSRTSAAAPTSVAAAMGASGGGFTDPVNPSVVFGDYTPATRFSVPTDYNNAGRPFWVNELKYKVVLTNVLENSGSVVNPVTLGQEEVRWFAKTLVNDWNRMCDRIVTDAITVKAALDLHRVNRLHSAHVDSMRRLQEEMAYEVRMLSDVHGMLKGLYRIKPFDIIRSDLTGDHGVSAEYQKAVVSLTPSAHPQYAQVGYTPRTSLHHNELVYVHSGSEFSSPTLADSPPRMSLGRVGAYTWHAPPATGTREDRYRAASDRGSMTRSVGAGSGSSSTRSSTRRAG